MPPAPGRAEGRGEIRRGLVDQHRQAGGKPYLAPVAGEIAREIERNRGRIPGPRAGSGKEPRRERRLQCRPGGVKTSTEQGQRCCGRPCGLRRTDRISSNTTCTSSKTGNYCTKNDWTGRFICWIAVARPRSGFRNGFSDRDRRRWNVLGIDRRYRQRISRDVTLKIAWCHLHWTFIQRNHLRIF